VFYDFGWATPFVGETLGGFLDRISFHTRFAAFSEGLVVPADLIFFAGVAALGAALARTSLDWVRVR
jgi:hypothetical protein